MRDYGVQGQIGLEATVEEYIEKLGHGFDLVKQKLTKTGMLFVNIADSRNWRGVNRQGKCSKVVEMSKYKLRDHGFKRQRTQGYREGELIPVASRLVTRLREANWFYVSEIIWMKKNARCENTSSRPWNISEKILVFSKQRETSLDMTRISRDFRGNVWVIAASKSDADHPAPFPILIPQLCIDASTNCGDTILDPFAGSGTTARAAIMKGRAFIGIELNRSYEKMWSSLPLVKIA
jgi:DNA modification methylase